MKAKFWVGYFSLAALAMRLAGYATTTSPPAAAGGDSTKAQITVLYDAFGKSSAMQKDWGMPRSLNMVASASSSTPATTPTSWRRTRRRKASIYPNSTSSSCPTAMAITWEAWPMS